MNNVVNYLPIASKTYSGVEFILENPTADPTARPASSMKSTESSLMIELTLIFRSTYGRRYKTVFLRRRPRNKVS
jgi:hypothetical protein